MFSRFFKVMCIALFLSVIAGQSKADLILGTIVQDEEGIEWAYVGSFLVADGPFWNDRDDLCMNDPNLPDDFECMHFADALNGIEAAEQIFGALMSGEYALSTVLFVVEHMAHYDSRNQTPQKLADDVMTETATSNPNGLYDFDGDFSAFVQDRTSTNPNTGLRNYVFQSLVSVSAPSTLAIIFVALLGIGFRRLKY